MTEDRRPQAVRIDQSYIRLEATAAALNRDLALAQEIQDSLAPLSSTLTAGRYHASFYQQKFAALGGDWMGARTLATGELVVVVADATGKRH